MTGLSYECSHHRTGGPVLVPARLGGADATWYRAEGDGDPFTAKDRHKQ